MICSLDCGPQMDGDHARLQRRGMMLQNYRNIIWALESFPNQIAVRNIGLNYFHLRTGIKRINWISDSWLSCTICFQSARAPWPV